MPVTCGCTQACNCTISEDGYLSGHPELGRNFTQIDGIGNSTDPYVFHFYDQEEFRPRAAELSVPNQNIPNNTYTNIQDSGNIASIIYQSPKTFLFNDPFIDNLEIFEGNYFIFGATATFDQAADTSATYREMLLINTRGISGVGDNYISGAQLTPGGSTDPITVSCETLNPGLFNSLTGLEAILGAFQVYLFQNSGAPLGVSDIRIWLTQI